MKLTTVFAATALLIATSAGAIADGHSETNNPIVGGAPMLPSRDIVGNAVNSADHTTLIAAVRNAGLVETLQSEGPFTVFAPVNAAFADLPPRTVDTLMAPENGQMLTKVLTAHVVAGDVSTSDIAAAARGSSDGFYHFNALSGDALSAQIVNDSVYIYDESGNAGRITIADVEQLNGMIHVVDTVLVPR
ncbi:MAG: fasciclin domain-containing protein [Pseudomonadota bacterium]